ncbi:hypothetical protein QFC19_000067 [Naganishia cerealis]|uniref:Uncharacterized protein n=1 Tax=Naganishia cerealis TaxID=610337 RepID=A0ACC2WQ21_9TREE|nr:hypothetical protein QFC19_000067 [Naganishia cerealis]
MSPAKPLILVCVPLWPTPDDVLPFFKARLAGKDLPPQKPRHSVDVQDAKLPYEVRYYPTPNEAGEGNAPTKEEWERCQVLVCLQIPEPSRQRRYQTSVSCSSPLPVWDMSNRQLCMFRKLPQYPVFAHILTSCFAVDWEKSYRSIPDDSELIVCSASGIHVVPISEHVIATTMALYHNFPKFILSGAQDPPRWIKMPELGNGGFVKWYTTTDRHSLAEFYGAADVLVNSLPSTEETRGFVAEQAFRDMRDDAVFVNIGRGDTVDQDVMIQALEAGLKFSTGSGSDDGKPSDKGNLRISAASLDVTSPEPLPPTNKLWRLPNVLLTPHMSGGSELYWYRVTDLASINVRRVLKDGLGGLNAVRGRGED